LANQIGRCASSDMDYSRLAGLLAQMTRALQRESSRGGFEGRPVPSPSLTL
jgi:hypothetical protein